MVDRRGFPARRPGPSFLGGCVEDRGGAVALRLPAEAAMESGPARVEVSFEGFPQRFVLTGVVATSGRRFGATTVELEVEKASRELKALLDFAASDPRAPRRSPRFPLGALVEVTHEGAARTAILQDVSASGCFLQIPGPRLPAIGHRLSIEPRFGAPVAGEVVRTYAASPRGVGVRFASLDDAGRAQVKRWLDAAMASAKANA